MMASKLGTSQTEPLENAAPDQWSYPFPTTFKINDERHIDEPRSLRVAVIGAGLTGITAGVLLPIKVPGIDLTIFEKNDDFGGTWFENVYPGVRCDIPAHVYQSTFDPNTQWTEEYAQGREILAYWQNLARKHNLPSITRLKTKVELARWHPDLAQWELNLNNVGRDRQYSEFFDFVITAIGVFNNWKLPEYPGMEDFKGPIIHSSNWTDFDASGKRIATIGNGASGIQVTTELHKVASHVDHYARSRTWIAGSFAPGVRDRQDVPMVIPTEKRDSFNDAEAYLTYRKELESAFFRSFDGYLLDSEVNRNSREKFTEMMQKRLADKPELLQKLLPDFPPNCRRLTPGPGYLEALTKPHVELIQTPIERFTSDGIVTTDGSHRPVDAVICSTGANVNRAPPFPIIARDLDLSRDWAPDGKFGWPYTYLGTYTPGFPNLAFLLGPTASGVSGTVPYAVETQVTYIAKMLRKISTQGISAVTPSKAATDDFVAWCDAMFPRMTLSQYCSSWSNGGKAGQRIHGHWPGSALHLSHVRREPRWEDFEYTYKNGVNRFSYFGAGQTKKEKDQDSDVTLHLRLAEANDLRDLHERWWDV
jgi:cation diffusion facilitator CzcD-associated flavoprotein CzcO